MTPVAVVRPCENVLEHVTTNSIGVKSSFQQDDW